VGLGATHTPTRHHVKILATISSRSDPETLATREVLAHLHAAFHLYTCRLCGGDVVVADALIGYNSDHEEETIMINYFIYTDARLRRIATPTLLPLLSVSSSNGP
jgi:hypothetical protein